jgi:hypothetical protein
LYCGCQKQNEINEIFISPASNSSPSQYFRSINGGIRGGGADAQGTENKIHQPGALMMEAVRTSETSVNYNNFFKTAIAAVTDSNL